MLFPNIEHLIYWIKERQSIYLKKTAGEPKPWTTDPCLRDYRYCNVFREQDAVTIWIRDHWRIPFQHHPKIWFAMCVARLFNNPETLETIGYPMDNFPIERWKYQLEKMKAEKKRIFNAAYIVSTNGKAKDKVLYVLEDVLMPLFLHGRAPIAGETLESYAEHLMIFDGMGSFLSGQVVADLKYIDPLKNAPDWWTWCNPGPGSRRGMNRMLDAPVDAPITKNLWNKAIGQLRDIVKAETALDLCAQDLQNALCETDKYMRLVTRQGTPKQRYHGV